MVVVTSETPANTGGTDGDGVESDRGGVASRTDPRYRRTTGDANGDQHPAPGKKKRKWRGERRPARRRESLQTIQLVLAIVLGGLGLIVAVTQIVDRFLVRPAPKPPVTKISTPVTRMLEQLEVLGNDWAFIEGLTNRFVAKNPPREKAMEYVRAKKAAISQVRYIASTQPIIDGSRDADVESALEQGDIESIESLLGPGDGNVEVSRDTATLSEGQHLFRAHLAILVDEPQMARRYFEIVAARIAEADLQRARHLLADGADNLASVGCALGGEWLDAAIELYEGSLANWSKEDQPTEWAIIQNNHGAALLSSGTGYDDNDHALNMLQRSAEAFRRAREVFGFGWDGSLANSSIVYRNWHEAVSEMLTIDRHNPELEQDQAVALRAVLSNSTRAMSRGGQDAVDRLDEAGRSMLIESTRQATKAQRLRLMGDPNPCQRSP